MHLSYSSDEKNDPMCVKNLAQFGVNAVQHQDPEVRQAGQELVLLLYKVIFSYQIIHRKSNILGWPGCSEERNARGQQK